MKIGVMRKGDEILNVTSEFIAVRRKNKEVDILPLVREETGWRIDTENIVTIGYGENTITVESETGVEITSF